VSVSGEVSRTIEALELAGEAGGFTVALTGNANSGLGKVAKQVVLTKMPAFTQTKLAVPGVRSYIASQIALHLCAIQLGEMRGHLPKTTANKLRYNLVALSEPLAQTIAHCDPIAHAVTEAWHNATQFVFCGTGNNYGTAGFAAAKILEASGDPALAQESEEWAHLQYFAREVDTPTFFITGGQSDIGRTRELATAAKAIGRRVAVVGSTDCDIEDRDVLLPIAGNFSEPLSPLLTPIPAVLFAAYRAQMLGEPYFRNFDGGRSAEGGGGISRIRTSDRWTAER
jgi:glucosamine--fructose-6-phosphate aminotransferase (isomerizing)